MTEATVVDPPPKLCLSGVANELIFDLQYNENGEIDLLAVSSNDKSHDGAIQSSAKPLTLVTKADDCSWNVYATKKPLPSFQTQNRPPIVDSSTNGRVVRVGNQVFFIDQLKEDGAFESFVPPNFSLSLDEVVRHGRYLIVSSRQKVETIPTVERDPPTGEAKFDNTDEKTSDAVETKADGDKKDSEKSDADTEAKDAETKKPETDSESEPEDDPYQVSGSDEELSACESWSEGSTDLDEIGVRAIQALRPEVPIPDPKQKKTITNGEDSNTTSDDDTSSDDESDSDKSCGCCHSDSDSDASIVDGDNQRFESQARNDEDEFYGMVDKIYGEDRDDPYDDNEEDEDDVIWSNAYEDSGWGLFGGEDDFEVNDFKRFEDDDSDDCSDCGGDDGACVKPPEDEKPKTKKGEDEDSTEPALGMPTAQIHVYDTSIPMTETDAKPSFKRLFRYQSMVAQPLRNSPPVIHHSKSLLVWPIGDSKILVADYKHNTYFIKRLRLSRVFSQHVSVSCQFSSDGQFLHVVALERQGKRPVRPKEMLKKKKLEKDKKEPVEKEVPVYDLVISTFRLSNGKTTRAPPVLIYQIKKNLGPIEEKYALPTYAWRNENVRIAHAAANNQVQVHEIELFKPSSKDTSVETKSTLIAVENDLAGRDIHLSKSSEDIPCAKLRAMDVVTFEVAQVRPFYKPESAEKKDKSETTAAEAVVANAKVVEEETNVKVVSGEGS